MLTLHHLNNSRSQRILWLLEELELEYEIKHYTRNPKTRLAPDELRKVHPLGKSPVLSDGDLNIAESAVIIEYLIENFGGDKFSIPSESEQKNAWRYWLHYPEGSLMPYLLLNLVFETIKTSPMPFFVKPIAKGIVKKVRQQFISPNIERHLSFIDHHLADNTWLLGEQLSGVDFQLSFPLEASASRGIVDKQYTHIHAYVKRFQARDAYQRALTKAGDYDFTLG